VSDIDTVVVDSLKALDPEWPIREADIVRGPSQLIILTKVRREPRIGETRDLARMNSSIAYLRYLRM
jgi:hypothetical protein